MYHKMDRNVSTKCKWTFFLQEYVNTQQLSIDNHSLPIISY